MPFYLPDERREDPDEASALHPSRRFHLSSSEKNGGADDLFYWNGGILIRVKHESVIVAIGAAKIAVGYEKDRAELAWPIQEGSLQESLDLDHGKIGLKSEARNPKFETISNSQISDAQNK